MILSIISSRRTDLLRWVFRLSCASLLLLSLIFPDAGWGSSFETSIDNDTVTITSYTGSGGAVSVPSSIGGLPVTRIGSGAFSSSSGLTSVSIPKSVTIIDGWAFWNCDHLASITLPSKLLSIGSLAFSGCTRLTKVTLPDGLQTIGDSAFSECSSLKILSIPPSVTQIGSRAFADCTSLTEIDVDPLNPAYCSQEGVLFDKGLTNLIQCPGAKAGDYSVPSSVKVIGEFAFRKCADLSSLILPSGVTDIGSSAFDSCTGLTSLSLPASVTGLGENAFAFCAGLTSVTLSPSLTSIERQMFYECTSLGSISIPQSVTTIGDSAFLGCHSLATVTLQEGLITIGDSAFLNCKSLKSITIPQSVTTIWSYAFNSCSSLTSVILPSGITKIWDGVFTDCSSLTSVNIPPAVTTIGGEAFSGCSSLANLTIPGGVTELGDSAFGGCASLTSVDLPASVTTIGSYAFAGCVGLTSLNIPQTLTHIGDAAFANCRSLTAFTADSLNPSYSCVDGVLFNKALTQLLQFPAGRSGTYAVPDSTGDIGTSAFSGCSNLTSITFPFGTSRIEDWAFLGCSNLSSISFSPVLNRIGEAAFSGCTSLRTVTLPATLGSIGNAAFYGCGNLTSVYFLGNAPFDISWGDLFSGDQNATVYYLPGAARWGDSFGGRPAAVVNPNLSLLNLSAGGITPNFSPEVNGYSLNVANAVATITVTATLADPKANLQARINGGAFITLASGTASGVLAPTEGANLIEVKVTAQDGVTSKIYGITLNRAAKPVTQSPSNVGSHTVTLGASAEGNSASFQYGTTASYGNITPPQLIVSGSGAHEISAILPGLAPATIYHARVVTTTGSTSDYGNDLTFLTAPAFPTETVAVQGDSVLGIPNARFLSFGVPAINDLRDIAFQAVISGSSGSGITSANNSGIWVVSASNSMLIARTGDAAPGGGFFATLHDPVLNSHDEVAFLGLVSGSGLSSNNGVGIWANTSGTLHLVARTQSQALDSGGVKAASFSQIALPDSGGVLFIANLVNGMGGVTSKNNQGIWTESNGQFTSLLRKGDIVAGGTVSAISILGSPQVPVGVAGQGRSFNRSGDLGFKATFTNGKQGLFVLASGTELRQVATVGGTAPAMFRDPTKFGVLGNPILNDAGNTAFQALVSGTAKAAINFPAILAETGSSHELGTVALAGSPAPDENGLTGGLGSFASMGDPVFNNADQIAFMGKLTTGGAVSAANCQAIWANSWGVLALMARTQAQAPDCPIGAKFLAFSQLVLPDEGGVVFLAKITGPSGVIDTTNNQGIWAADSDGHVRLVARTGDVLMVEGVPKVVTALSIFTSTQGTAGQTLNWNRAGNLVYKATFSDKTQAILKVVFP